MDIIYIKCTKHGNAEALINGNCKQCRNDNNKLIEAEKLEQKVLTYKINSGIFERYQDCTFDNYKIQNNKQKQIVDDLSLWDKKTNILMLGKVGTGKTHLSCALLDRAIRKGKSGYFINFYNLIELKLDNKSRFNELLNVNILVIDEFARMSIEFKEEIAYEILYHRYNRMLPTILISNLTVEKLKKILPDNLYSRLKENILHLNFDWEDYRLQDK